jgi:hypothetical protein
MLTIQLLVNGDRIDEIEVVNRGPVGGSDGASFDAGDSEGGGGLRRYEWRVSRTTKSKHRGVVVHRRSDGARALAMHVLADIELIDGPAAGESAAPADGSEFGLLNGTFAQAIARAAWLGGKHVDDVARAVLAMPEMKAIKRLIQRECFDIEDRLPDNVVQWVRS